MGQLVLHVQCDLWLINWCYLGDVRLAAPNVASRRVCAVMAYGIKSVIGGLDQSKEPTMIKCHEILFICLQ